MEIAEINTLHQRLFERVRRLPGHESWNGDLGGAVGLLARKLSGGKRLSRIIAGKNNYTEEQRRELEKRINASYYGLRDPKILQMVLDVWESLERKPYNSSKVLKEPKSEKTCLPQSQHKLSEVEINALHLRVFQRVRKLPDHEAWDGTLNQAISRLVSKLGGFRVLVETIVGRNDYTDEQREELERKIRASDYGLRDPKVLQIVLDGWESPRNLKDKEKAELVILVRRMDQFQAWKGSSDSALALLGRFVAGGTRLAHMLKELELIKDEKSFRNRFITPMFRNKFPAPEIMELACTGWRNLLDQNRFDLDPDRPYKKASDLVRRIKGFEKWSHQKPLKEAIAVLAKELGSYIVLVSVLQEHKHCPEEQAEKFKVMNGVINSGCLPPKIETDLALELWELILDNPEITKPVKRIKFGSVDLDKDYPEATVLVRRQLGMRDWKGTLDDAIPILRKLGGAYVIARMLDLSKKQQQRIASFLRDSGPLNPREEDLQCALEAWGIILDRRARGLSGSKLTAPVRRRRSHQVAGSSLNDALITVPQDHSPETSHAPEPVS